MTKRLAVDTSETLLRGEIRARDDRVTRRDERSAQRDESSEGRADRPPQPDELPARRDASPARRDEIVLGRYRLLDRLGAGGFGTVWRAHDKQLARTVALKRIALPSPQERERAVREAQATARLSHPAIVALYEACADEDAFYLVSELVEGDTLAVLIAADELADDEIAEIGFALAGGLQHAHTRGVVHRDVKPQNVLVPAAAGQLTPGGSSPSAAAKLADFGGALMAGGEALTRTGDVYGTLAYMAPEQCDGHEVGPPADVYSLALVLYEAFSGVNPVRGRTPAATARRIGAPIEPLRGRRRDISRALADTIDAAMIADPGRRAMLDDLQEALDAFLSRGARRRRPLGRRHGQPNASVHLEHRSLGPEHRLDEVCHHPREEHREHYLDQPPRLDRDTSDQGAARGADVLALPRMAWLGLAVAAAIWQAADGLPGVALLLLAAVAPMLLLARRPGPGWLAAAVAPVLGVVGIAGAFPALAGQRATVQARAGLAALGFWWLALAEPLLIRRLWLGVPAGVGGRSAWEGSFGRAATHVLGAVATPEVVIGAAVWALAGAVLPWIVRGRSVALDALAAIAWSAAALAAPALAERALLNHAAAGSPRGAVLGATLGCVVAICARALRGPVGASRS